MHASILNLNPPKRCEFGSNHNNDAISSVLNGDAVVSLI